MSSLDYQIYKKDIESRLIIILKGARVQTTKYTKNYSLVMKGERKKRGNYYREQREKGIEICQERKIERQKEREKVTKRNSREIQIERE